MPFRKGSTLLRLATGFVTGSAVGWAVHDYQDGSNGSLYSRLVGESTKVKRWDDNWDRRDPKFLEESRANHLLRRSAAPKTDKNNNNSVKELKKATATRHLFLIRHGQYNLDGATDLSRTLTPLGMEQAALTAQRLRDLEHPYTVLIHSTMSRARQTADAVRQLLPEVPVVETDLLREGAPCPPEPPLHNWRPDYKDGARIEAAFRKYFHRADVSQTTDSYEIVVCHANVIRYFVCRALQLPPEAWLRISLNHGSITWLTIRPSGRVVLRSVGDVGYMPAEKVTVV